MKYIFGLYPVLGTELLGLYTIPGTELLKLLKFPNDKDAFCYINEMTTGAYWADCQENQPCD